MMNLKRVTVDGTKHCPFLQPTVMVEQGKVVNAAPAVSVVFHPCMVGRCAVWDEEFKVCGMQFRVGA